MNYNLTKGDCMKKRISSILMICIIVTASAGFAANKAEQFSISPVIGGYTFEGKQHLDTALIYGIRAGYNVTDNFGIEALFDYVNTDSNIAAANRVEMFRYGGELLYHFMPKNKFVPYLAVGLSGLNFDAVGVDKKTRAAVDYGLGAKYFVNDKFALRGDVRHIFYSYNSQTRNNLEYTLGAYVPFGRVKPAAKPVEPQPAPAPAPKIVEPAPAPAPVVPAAPAAPTATLTVTPAKVTKGQIATLNWESQNASGCNIQPGIGPVLPQGVRTITPAANTSYIMECSGAGGRVTSAAGVTVVFPPSAPPVVSKAAERFCNKPSVIVVEFDTGKATVKPSHKYDAEVKVVGDFLKEFPKAKGEISGHTDNVASKAYNDKLSQARADNIKKFLVEKSGVAADRITTKGYGFSKPVANNKTREGRARNRRIEANFTCE